MQAKLQSSCQEYNRFSNNLPRLSNNTPTSSNIPLHCSNKISTPSISAPFQIKNTVYASTFSNNTPTSSNIPFICSNKTRPRQSQHLSQSKIQSPLTYFLKAALVLLISRSFVPIKISPRPSQHLFRSKLRSTLPHFLIISPNFLINPRTALLPAHPT